MITSATIEDIPALIALGLSTYRAHYSGIWSGQGLTDYLDAQFDPEMIKAEMVGHQSQYLFMHHDGALAGYAKLNFNRPMPVDSSRVGTELQKIYFLPDATGLGLGRQLIAHLLTQADEGLIWLDVLKSNAGGRRLYERCGFTVAGELPFATDIQQIDMWVMVHDRRR